MNLVEGLQSISIVILAYYAWKTSQMAEATKKMAGETKKLADDIELQHEFLREKAILLNFLKKNRNMQGDPNWNELIEKGLIKKDHLSQVLYSVEMDKDGFYFDPIDIESKTK